MKPQLSIFALALMFPIGSHAADQAAQTRAHYAAVERAIPKARVVKRELDGYSGERGELTAYFQNGAPRKMIARHFFNTFRVVDELYFWNGPLFFVLHTRENYNHPITGFDTPVKVTSRDQDRYYFNNGQLTRWSSADGKIIESGAAFKAQQKEQLYFAREMLAGARGTAKIIIAPKL